MNNRQQGVPFRPIYGSAIQVAATTTSGATRVAIPAIALPAVCCRIKVNGANSVRFRSGSSTVTALTLVDPEQDVGATEVWGINANDTHFAAITDTGTGTLEIVFGTGM